MTKIKWVRYHNFLSISSPALSTFVFMFHSLIWRICVREKFSKKRSTSAKLFSPLFSARTTFQKQPASKEREKMSSLVTYKNGFYQLARVSCFYPHSVVIKTFKCAQRDLFSWISVTVLQSWVIAFFTLFTLYFVFKQRLLHLDQLFFSVKEKTDTNSTCKGHQHRNPLTQNNH